MTDNSKSSLLDRRAAMLGLGASLVLPACATSANDPTGQSMAAGSANHGSGLGTYSENELIEGISHHLGVTSESAASTIERLFKDRGRPTAYITGEEGGGAFIGGARYGKGTLWMKNGMSRKIYWQGPSNSDPIVRRLLILLMSSNKFLKKKVDSSMRTGMVRKRQKTRLVQRRKQVSGVFLWIQSMKMAFVFIAASLVKEGYCLLRRID